MSQTVDLTHMSPRAVELLKEFSRTSGVESIERVIEEETFSILELMRLVNTDRDIKIYPQDAVMVFNTVKTVVERFKRFGLPTQLKK
jgi:hypothetical protein